MSAFAPEEYQAHLIVATDGLTVSQVEIVERAEQERIHALVADVVPLDLLAWQSESQLRQILAAEWPHLRATDPVIIDRLELARGERSFAELSRQPLTPAFAEIFQIDDEAVRLRLGRFRRNINQLFGKT